MSLNEYDAVRSAENILAGLATDRLIASVSADRLRTFLIERIDPAWSTCKITRHQVADGYVQWTASRLCGHCYQIYTLVVDILADGSFAIAQPMDEE